MGDKRLAPMASILEETPLDHVVMGFGQQLVMHLYPEPPIAAMLCCTFRGHHYHMCMTAPNKSMHNAVVSSCLINTEGALATACKLFLDMDLETREICRVQPHVQPTPNTRS